MHELFFGHRSEIEAFEQRELLQGDRTRAPGSGLADGDAAKVEGHDGFDRRAPARQIVAREQAPLRRAETVDLIRDEAFVEQLTSTVDLIGTRSAPRLFGETAIRRCEPHVA